MSDVSAPRSGRSASPAACDGKENRRSDPRTSGPHVSSIAARIRGGHDFIVLDVSASGALIGGTRPLRPGARIEVHLAIDVHRLVLPARVARCLVAAIDAERGIIYHAALSFERRFDWLREEGTLVGSGMHEVCSS